MGGCESDPPRTVSPHHPGPHVYTAISPRPLAVPALPTIPLKAIAPWVMFAVFLLLALYFAAADQGATSLVPGHMVHEFVHDARHLLGFPCH